MLACFLMESWILIRFFSGELDTDPVYLICFFLGDDGIWIWKFKHDLQFCILLSEGLNKKY